MIPEKDFRGEYPFTAQWPRVVLFNAGLFVCPLACYRRAVVYPSCIHFMYCIGPVVAEFWGMINVVSIQNRIPVLDKALADGRGIINPAAPETDPGESGDTEAITATPMDGSNIRKPGLRAVGSGFWIGAAILGAVAYKMFRK